MLRNFVSVVIVLCVLTPSWSQAPQDLPRIGEKLDRRTVANANKQRLLCATSPAQLDPCFERVYGGVRFTVAYRDETKRVSYIYTVDEDFRTVEGMKVLDQIPVSTDSVRAWPGWLVEAQPTVDGWAPIVSGPDMTVELSDGTLLNIIGEQGGSSRGNAIIRGFGKRREQPTSK